MKLHSLTKAKPFCQEKIVGKKGFTLLPVPHTDRCGYQYELFGLLQQKEAPEH
jgi:hypothetical protein